jgi:hypothetical protein
MRRSANPRNYPANHEDGLNYEQPKSTPCNSEINNLKHPHKSDEHRKLSSKTYQIYTKFHLSIKGYLSNHRANQSNQSRRSTTEEKGGMSPNHRANQGNESRRSTTEPNREP